MRLYIYMIYNIYIYMIYIYILQLSYIMLHVMDCIIRGICILEYVNM